MILVGLFPWSAWLPSAVRHIFSRGRETVREEQTALHFLLIWAGFILVFFSLAKTKLPAYIFSAFPPMALMVGWFLARCLPRASATGVWPVPRLSTGIFILSGTVFLGVAGGAAFVLRQVPHYAPGILPALSMLGALGLAVLALWALRRERLVVWACVLVIGLSAVVITTRTFPAVDPLWGNKHLSELARRAAEPGANFYVYYAPIGSTVFYTRAKVMKIRTQVEDVLSSEERAFIFGDARNLAFLRQVAGGRAVLLGESGKKCLLTNKPVASP
jgi:4-amino-4-deoxy-L-arabinose transferase-like glycosyltransferase